MLKIFHSKNLYFIIFVIFFHGLNTFLVLKNINNLILILLNETT